MKAGEMMEKQLFQHGDKIPAMVTIREVANQTGLSYDYIRKICMAADSFNLEQSITDRMQQRELEAVLWHCRVTFGATGENNPAA